jgi:hypothetical protein
METVIRNVRDLDQIDRSAMERVLGHELNETERIIVNVVSLDLAPTVVPASANPADVPPWWNVYEGLDEEEIDRLDGAIRERANLTRSFE